MLYLCSCLCLSKNIFNKKYGIYVMYDTILVTHILWTWHIFYERDTYFMKCTPHIIIPWICAMFRCVISDAALLQQQQQQQQNQQQSFLPQLRQWASSSEILSSSFSSPPTVATLASSPTELYRSDSSSSF